MQVQLSGDSIVTIAQAQVSCEVTGETVILHFDSGKYFGLKDVGALVWNLLERPRSVRELREAILRGYEVGGDQCERDLLNLLKELHDHGLIEVRNETAA